MKLCVMCNTEHSKTGKCCSRECSTLLRKQTCLKKYNVEHPLQTDELKDKVKQTNLERYGVEHPLQSEEIKNKSKQIMLEKYGGYTFQSNELKEKVKQTNFERYGVENPSQSEEIKDKKKQTLFKNYSVENPSQSEEIKDKKKQSFLKKYGVEHPLQSEEIKDKIKTTNFERYGVEHLKQIHIPKEFLTQDWWVQRTGFLEAKELIGNHISECQMYRYAHQFRPDWDFRSSISQPHQAVINLLNEHQIVHETNSRKVIAPLELDIFIPSKNVAIEVNGLYWHSELNGKDRTYHVSKTNACEQQGIQLLQFWDTEIENQWTIIKSMILSKLGIYQTRIGARKCKVIQVPSIMERFFLNENHLQGYRPSSVCLGLEYQNTLVSLMSFAKSRFSSKFDWELLRFCNKLNTQVIGGASKLFSQKPEGSLISYSDRRYSQGNLYSQLGMNQQESSAPSYFYTQDFLTLENRIKYQKHKLSEKLESYDPFMTEWDNMKTNGFDRVWDCGNSVFTFNDFITQ